MDDLEQKKLEAEIERIKAETKGLQRSWVDGLAKWLKVIGAGVVGVGGFVAALTTYQITEARTAAAQERVQTVEAQAAAANARFELAKLHQEDAETALAQVNQMIQDRQRDLEELQRKAAAIEAALQDGLARLEGTVSRGTAPTQSEIVLAKKDIAAAAKAHAQLETDIKEAVSRAKDDIRTTVSPRIRTSVPPSTRAQ